MCTISWFHQPEGYTLFFNRDESRQRQPGLPPEAVTSNGIPCLCPRDPEGGGTWLLVNQHGLTLGLLNYYEAEVDYRPAQPKSRGRLPLACAACASLEAVKSHFRTLDLAAYPPFHFLALDRQVQALLLTWNGRGKQWSRPAGEDLPLSTSSFETGAVLRARRDWYHKCIKKFPTVPESLEYFHTSNQPKPDTHAVLMTRDNARTVSVTRVDVNGNGVRMSYRARPDDSPALAPEVVNTLPAAGKGV